MLNDSKSYNVFWIIIIAVDAINNCLFKLNNRNSVERCEICSELTIKTPEQRQ